MKYQMYKLISRVMVCCASCIVISCNDKSQSIPYSTASLESLTSKDITPEKIPLDFQLTAPTQIERIGDTLLVIFDADADKKCKLLNPKGTTIGEFVQLGHAKDEFISPVGISVADENIINVYDYSTGLLTGYSVPDVMAGNKNPCHITNLRGLLDNSKKANTTINFVQSIGYNRHLLFGNNQNRIMLLDGEKINYIYGKYPNTDSDEECNWAIWGHSAKYKLSPDNKHLVLTTYIGALFEIFNLNDEKVESSILKGFTPPEYSVVSGATPKWISPEGDSPEGFYALCTSKDRFYASIGGMDCKRRNEIYSFDYEGNSTGKYVFPGDVMCFTLVNDTFFFIIEGKNGEYGLYKAKLQDFV